MENIATKLSTSLASAVERVAPSLLRIEGQRSGATAVAWSDAGIVLASRHFIDREDSFEAVSSDGTRRRAELVGRDAGTDLAIFRAENPLLAVPSWTDLDDVRVGHIVVAVGRASRSLRASFGIVRALGDGYRTHAGGKIERYVEAQIAPEPGISGSVLVDTEGRALGVVTAGLRRGRLVVVPRVTLARVVASVVSHGRVQRGYLGVSAYPVRLPGTTDDTALMLMAIEPGGPAEQAGLLLGDIVLSLDGERLTRVSDLVSVLDEDRSGRSVKADLLRAGQKIELSVTVGARAVEDG